MPTPDYSAMTTLELANSIKTNLDRYLELEREYAALYNLPVPVPVDARRKNVEDVSLSVSEAREGIKLAGPQGKSPATLAAGNSTLPDSTHGVGRATVAQSSPADVGGKAQAQYARETLSAVRTVAQLNPRLDPTSVELAEILSNINHQ